VAPVEDPEPGELHRGRLMQTEDQRGRDAVALVLEGAGPRSVPNGVASPGRQRRGRGAPRRPALLVAQVEHFSGWITDRIVGPRGEPIEVTARGPGASGAALGYQAPAGGVGDHVGPRRRRQLAV